MSIELDPFEDTTPIHYDTFEDAAAECRAMRPHGLVCVPVRAADGNGWNVTIIKVE